MKGKRSEKSTDVLPSLPVGQSLTRGPLYQKCLCFAGGGADVHSQITASHVQGPPTSRLLMLPSNEIYGGRKGALENCLKHDEDVRGR